MHLPPFCCCTSFEVSAVSDQSINRHKELLSFVETTNIDQNLLSPLIALMHSGIGLEKHFTTISKFRTCSILQTKKCNLCDFFYQILRALSKIGLDSWYLFLCSLKARLDLQGFWQRLQWSGANSIWFDSMCLLIVPLVPSFPHTLQVNFAALFGIFSWLFSIIVNTFSSRSWSSWEIGSGGVAGLIWNIDSVDVISVSS